MTVRPAGAADVPAVIQLIVAEQARPERHIPYLTEEPDGIAAELAALDPPWTERLHVAIDGDAVIGAAFADVDQDLARAWIHGPWVSGDDDRWTAWAGLLVDAVEASLPDDVTDIELSGDSRHGLVALLARTRGHEASEINWVYTRPVAPTDDGDDARGPAVRDAVPTDAEAIGPLHDAEFPGTYLPVERMLAEAAAGARQAIVAVDPDGGFLGYASGEIQPDGAGYIDFLAVAPGARGQGTGRALVTGLVARLRPAVTTGAIHLTVQDHRAPARALYEGMGFGVDIGIVAYRRR